MLRCVFYGQRLLREINGEKKNCILYRIVLTVLLMVALTCYLPGCAVFFNVLDRSVGVGQHANPIHRSLAKDTLQEQMPTTYILDFGKQRFIKNIAIYCYKPVKDVAIYICSSKPDQDTSPPNLGWTFLKNVEFPIENGDIIEIQMVVSYIQLVQEITVGTPQPNSKSGIRRIDAFGEYGNELVQAKLSTLQTLMLPDRWVLSHQSDKALKTSSVEREFWEEHYLQVFQTKYPKLKDLRSIGAPLDGWPRIQRQAYLDAKATHERDLQQQRDLIDKRNFWAAAIVPVIWFYLTFYGLRWH